MPELLLDEETHQYTLDGRRLIGVTEALSILDDRYKVDPWYLQRGSALHLATEYHDKGTLDPESVGDDIRGFFEAYLKFLRDTGFKPIHSEQRLSHPKYFYAGKIDRIGVLNGEPVIIDLKSGQKARVDELQGAAYWELCRSNGFIIRKVFDLYLKENGTYNLPTEIENPKLLVPVFLALVAAYRWKEKL